MEGSREGILASEVAVALKSELVGDDILLNGVCTLSRPKPGRLGFIKKLEDCLNIDHSAASDAVFIVPDDELISVPWRHIPTPNPRAAFALALQLYFAPRPVPGIARTAIVDPTVQLGERVVIGEYCVLGPGVVIGDDTELRHNVVVGRNVSIGKRCLIRSNSVIGEEGFGIERDDSDLNRRIPHVGSVVIGDDVEIGALNTVCSGTIDPTFIEDFVKTDDHVHVAHNCKIGRNSILTACAELSGSVVLGDDVWIGPNSAVINGATLGDRVFTGIGSVVIRNCDANGVYIGAPARRIRDRKPKGTGA